MQSCDTPAVLLRIKDNSSGGSRSQVNGYSVSVAPRYTAALLKRPDQAEPYAAYSRDQSGKHRSRCALLQGLECVVAVRAW